MKISKNNIAFSTIRAKMIRSRKTKGGGFYNTSKTNNSVKARAATLAQKNAAMAQSGRRKSTASSMLEETRSNYTAMKSAAEDVQSYLGHLLSTKEGSLFQKAEESKDTSGIVSEIKSFVEDYNKMVRKMTSEGGAVNELYVRQLKGLVVSNRSKLENIGITEDKNGLLTIDREKLESADLEKLKNVFQGEDSFASKVAEKVKKVEENAQTNLNSLNSATYSSLLANYGSSGSKYNFLA